MDMTDWALKPDNQNWPQKKLPTAKQPDGTFLDTWAEKSAIWGTRHGIGEALDRYFGLYCPRYTSGLTSHFDELGLDDFDGKVSGPLGNQNILKLRTDHISLKDTSWKNYKNQVKENLEPIKTYLKHDGLRNFFQDIEGKDYARHTLWEGNIKPFKELLSGCRENIFSNLSYISGIGLATASIIKTGVQHYRYWHHRDDNRLAGQWHTAYETAKALCQKTIQSFGSWEAAGVGMVLGQALFPICAFPIGGILLGALFATTVYKSIGKLFPSLAKPGLSKN